tara:strand:+ start:1280 stop:1516 length:237 start_codon:yes stop_codon:yes gene_type:complete
LFGWFIGILLSVIPRRLYFIFHQIGETKAAEDYEELKAFAEKDNITSLFGSIQIIVKLETIIQNEKSHSDTFGKFLTR